MKSFKIPTV